MEFHVVLVEKRSPTVWFCAVCFPGRDARLTCFYLIEPKANERLQIRRSKDILNYTKNSFIDFAFNSNTEFAKSQNQRATKKIAPSI